MHLPLSSRDLFTFLPGVCSPLGVAALHNWGVHQPLSWESLAFQLHPLHQLLEYSHQGFFLPQLDQSQLWFHFVNGPGPFLCCSCILVTELGSCRCQRKWSAKFYPDTLIICCSLLLLSLTMLLCRASCLSPVLGTMFPFALRTHIVISFPSFLAGPR